MTFKKAAFNTIYFILSVVSLAFLVLLIGMASKLAIRLFMLGYNLV